MKCLKKYSILRKSKKSIKNILIFLILINIIENSLAFNKTHWNETTEYDFSTCCELVFGSCKSSCENLSLVQLAAVDPNGKEFKLNDLRRFCPDLQSDFWSCINRTLHAVSRGSQWYGRKCCTLAQTIKCQNTCATSSNVDDLTPACRRSDEQYMFTCFERQEMGDKCCGNARTSDCLQACRKIFEHQTLTPSKENRKYMEKVCGENNPRVLRCVKNFTTLTPIKNSKKYNPCCEVSTNSQCRETCTEALLNLRSIQEIIDQLVIGGCGEVNLRNPIWQCFLSDGKTVMTQALPNEVSQINQLGMDSAKLHCCHIASSTKCQRLCIQTYSNDWTSTLTEFTNDCLMQTHEIDLRQCINEVDEPCELGCDGLNFCSNFNNRPTELFRSCHTHADTAAQKELLLWKRKGFVSLPGMNLPIKNITKCSPNIWRAIACTFEIKPCTRGKHLNQICREDCYNLLSDCLDWTAVSSKVSASSICSKLSSEFEEVDCVSLKPYLEPSDIPTETGGHHRLTSPCKGNICNSSEVCVPFRNGTIGYSCIPGCSLGEFSLYKVPLGAYVRIPSAGQPKGCLKICRCGQDGKIDNCQPLPCINYDKCNTGGRSIQHANWFYLECNLCSCFAGEITCTKRQCRLPGISDNSFTSLPCKCPPHYVPVCGKNGKTYNSACIAKCSGLHDIDLEFGPCSSKNPCESGKYTCPTGTQCLPDRNVCLSPMHRPCLQYTCVNITGKCNTVSTPACDINGITYPSACKLLQSGKNFSHFGNCIKNCHRDGPVCGINGITYQSECEAWSDYSLVDYIGPCIEVGLLSSNMGPRCHQVKCSKLPSEYCKPIYPPGACCPICAGALRIIFSKKQIDRALYALKMKNIEILTLQNILKSLDSLIKITECQLVGFLTMETDLFIAVISREELPNHIQIEACSIEAEKIASLINTQSHSITSNLILSSLTVANLVDPDLENFAISYKYGDFNLISLTIYSLVTI
ncbi:reversion-inducing cysteine-rich protein with Kazal motifs, partial [Condylostylus longicornis]|uniref:reversion-inducing cysteine-rich protein with Kazal motifs n=1 Tax=Condylostylus longicornis TaxID=2530218 RepID=UPI00244E0F25